MFIFLAALFIVKFAKNAVFSVPCKWTLITFLWSISKFHRKVIKVYLHGTAKYESYKFLF